MKAEPGSLVQLKNISENESHDRSIWDTTEYPRYSVGPRTAIDWSQCRLTLRQRVPTAKLRLVRAEPSLRVPASAGPCGGAGSDWLGRIYTR